MALVLWMSTTAYAVASPAQIVIGFEPGEQVQTVAVRLDDAQASIPLFISYLGEERLTDIRLYASLRQPGQATRSGTLQFLNPTRNNEPLERIDFQPGEASRQVVLSIRDITATGKLAGFIGAETNAGNTRLVTLDVERPATRNLKVHEANERDEITLVTSGPQLNNSIFIQETSGQGGDGQEVILTVSGLRDAKSHDVKLNLVPQRFALTPKLAQRIDITGIFPVVGEFKGTLNVHYGDQQRNYALVIRREQGQDNIAITAISPAPVLRWPWSSASATVRLNLSEQSNGLASLYAPVLVKLMQIGSEAERSEASYGGWGLQDQAGNAVSSTQMLNLEPNQLTQMNLVIKTLRGSGQYQGTVSVQTPNGVEKQDTFSLFVKDNWALPALVILIGSLLSYWIRRWLESDRPWMLRAVNVRVALDAIAETIADTDKTLRAAMERRLNEALERSRIDESTDVNVTIKQIEGMLTHYVIIRDVLNLQADLPRVIPEPENRKTIEAALDHLRQGLNDQRLDTLQDAKLADDATAIRQEIANQSYASLVAVTSMLKDALNHDIDTEKQPDLQADLRVLHDQLPQLEHPASAASATGLNQAAWLAYDHVRQRYLRLNIRRFRHMLEVQSEAEGEFPGGWPQFKADILHSLTEEATPEQYNAARTKYLTGVLTALQKIAHQRAEALYTDPNHEREAAALDVIASQAMAALQQVAQAPDAAQAQYQTLQVDYRKLLKPVPSVFEIATVDRPKGLQEGEPLAEALFPGETNLREVSMLPPEPTPVSLSTLPELRAQVETKDLIAFGIIAIVSVVIGLQLLWVQKATFGGLADYITAFLWGFGLQELNKQVLPPTLTKLGLGGLPTAREGAIPSGQGVEGMANKKQS
jgi:hypothetical protein